MFVCSNVLTTMNYFRQLYTIYGVIYYFRPAIYYLRRLYITFGGYVLLSTAIYITFDRYILVLAVLDCDFVRIQDFITISRNYGLEARLDFIINLIQFCFFCSSMISSISFNVPS